MHLYNRPSAYSEANDRLAEDDLSTKQAPPYVPGVHDAYVQNDREHKGFEESSKRLVRLS